MGYPPECVEGQGYYHHYSWVFLDAFFPGSCSLMFPVDSMEEASALASCVGILAKRMLGMHFFALFLHMKSTIRFLSIISVGDARIFSQVPWNI